MSKTTEQKVNEIYDAVIGEGLHKGDGILDRLARLEAWRSKQSRVIGIVTGVAAIAGYAVTKLINLI